MIEMILGPVKISLPFKWNYRIDTSIISVYRCA